MPCGHCLKCNVFNSLRIIKFIHQFNHLFDCCFMQHSRIFHIYDGGQHYGERRPGSARGTPLTIRTLPSDLTMCSQRGES